MPIEAAITTSIADLLESPEFESWREDQEWDEDDLCVLNSSFLLRDGVKTNRSPRRLVLRSNAKGQLSLAGTTDGTNIRSPFKRFANSSKNLPAIKSIETAIEDELKRLGDVIFTLIGDLAPAAAGIVDKTNLPGVRQVKLDSCQAIVVQVVGDTIVVNNTHDEAAIWDALNTQFDYAETARPELGRILEKLEDKASRNVTVPVAGTRPKNPLLHELCSGLETQALEYQEALDIWTKSGYKSEGDLHQILRISYNFTSDTVRLIRLTISVCDLKPLVYWCTIKHHLALDTAIRSLPWQTHSKASLGAYIKIVNNARNHAFHDLFPVSSGLQVELPDAALRKVRLRLFSKHGSKTNRNEVQFEDQELVDLLTEFTRAGHRVTPPDFWVRNLATMQATLDLLEATMKSLILLRENSQTREGR